MSRPPLLLPALFFLAAIAGPPLCGTPAPPSIRATAAQFLPPGTRVDELRLRGGGYLRAPRLDASGNRLLIERDGRRHELSGVSPSGPIVTRRLWLGSDGQGRDLAARLAAGARRAALVGGLATLVACLAGLLVGLGRAFSRGVADPPLGLVTNALLGLPRLLALLALAAFLRRGALPLALAIGLLSWMVLARLVRERALRYLASSGAESALAAGAGRARLALRHLLPDLLPLLAAVLPVLLAESILLEATVSFLGIGGAAPSWGTMLADAARSLPRGWWILVFPGLALLATCGSLQRFTLVLSRAGRSRR